MLARLAFDEAYVLGHAVIDADHKVLVDSTQRLAQVIEKGNRTACTQVLKSLLGALKDHFGREIMILQNRGYPGVGAHAGLHRIIGDDLSQLVRGCQGKCDRDAGIRCYERVTEIVIEEIVEADSSFAPYLG
jgi:hemerythrin-like metal-binding protein